MPEAPEHRNRAHADFSVVPIPQGGTEVIRKDYSVETDTLHSPIRGTASTGFPAR